MRMNDLIMAKISGVSYVIGAVVAHSMPPLQMIALIIAIVSGGLSIGDRLMKFLKGDSATKKQKALVLTGILISLIMVMYILFI